MQRFRHGFFQMLGIWGVVGLLAAACGGALRDVLDPRLRGV
jgi:hypothetical protein